MNTTNITCFFLGVNLETTAAVFAANILTCIVNSVFSVTAILGNSIIILVIWKTQELHSPSFILLCCLAVSDLLVGLVCQPSLVAYKVAELMGRYNVYCITRIIQSFSSWTTSGASLLTLSAVCVDRVLALTLHLRYNTIITTQRVLQAVLFLWIFCTTVVTLRFCGMNNWIILPAFVVFLSFILTTLSNFKIFGTVRKHQRQIRTQQQTMADLHNVASVNAIKCRKSAVTVLYVYGLFLIFYLPFLLTMVADVFMGYTLSVKIAYDFATILVFINSSLNPFVYCWRVREIRQVVKNMVKKQEHDGRTTDC